MAYRYYDWECSDCGDVHPDLVWVDGGQKPAAVAQLSCPACEDDTLHERRISCPAQYTYDRPYQPIVYGGKYDTMGYKQPPQLPDLPRDACFDQARDMLTSKDRKDRVHQRMAVVRENKLKRQRAAAMKRQPTIDIRNTPLPGDPVVKPMRD